MWMEKGDPSAIRDFLQRHDGSYVAEKLRADWIRWLGKRGMRGAEIDVELPETDRPRTRCHLLSASRRGSPLVTKAACSNEAREAVADHAGAAGSRAARCSKR